LAGAVISGDLKKIVELTGEVYEFGYDLRYFFRDLVDLFRSLLLVKMGCTPGPLLNLSREEMEEMGESAAAVSLDFLQDGLHFLIQAEGDLRRSSQPRLSLELVLLRLAQLREVVSIEALLNVLEQVNREEATPEAAKPRPLAKPEAVAAPRLKEEQPEYAAPPPRPEAKEPPAREGADTAGDIQTVDEAVACGVPDPEALLSHIRREALPLASILENGRLRVVDENTLEWDFGEKPFYQGLMESNGNTPRLEKLCRDFLRKKVRINVVSRVPEDTGGRKPKAAQLSQKKRKLVKETLENPQVKEVLHLFEGEVVEVKVPD
jgi:DNA polymerase-3 subunit gamma/tau